MLDSKRDTDVNNRLLDSVGEGEGGLFQEISIETCIFIKSETGHQPRLDAWDKCLDLVHWDDPEGWDGEGDGREGQDGEHIHTHGWFMSTYGINNENIVK